MGENGSPIIEIQDLWRSYEMAAAEVHALQGVSLTIRRNIRNRLSAAHGRINFAAPRAVLR